MVQPVDPLSAERNLLQLAKQGDAEAIAELLNRSLHQRGITAQARLQDDTLHVFLDAIDLPAPQDIMPFVQQSVASLGVPLIRMVQVYGRRRGDMQPAWQQGTTLNSPVTPYSPAGQVGQPLPAQAGAYGTQGYSPQNYASAYSPQGGQPQPYSPVGNGTIPVTQFEVEETGEKVVIGDKVIHLTSHGGRVSFDPQPQPNPQPRPRPQPQYYCRPVTNLLDRQQETNRIMDLLRDAQPVEIHGEPGVGKTLLLRSLAFSPDLAYLFQDGIIYRAVHQQPIDDLMQSLFDDFYEYEEEAFYKPTPEEIQQRLRGKRSLVILDDVDLPAEDVQTLLTSLPSLNFLLAGRSPHLWGEEHRIELEGLPTEQAIDLAEVAINTSFTEEERGIAQALCTALSNHPLRIVQASALVRERRLNLPTLVQQIQAAPSPEVLILRAVSTLPEPQRRILAAISVLGTTPVAAYHLGTITAISNLPPVLEDLVSWGLLTTDGVRYALAGNLLTTIRQYWNLTPWIQPVIRHFVNWSAQHARVRGTLAQESDTLLAVMATAAQQTQWKEVLHLARQADQSLPLSGHWGAWEQVWQRGLQAARELGDQGAIANALHQLGTRALGLNDALSANTYLTQALQLRQSINDPGANTTRHNLEFLLNPNAQNVQSPPVQTVLQTPPIYPSTHPPIHPSTHPPSPDTSELQPPPGIQPSRSDSRIPAAVPISILAALAIGAGGFLAYQAIRTNTAVAITPDTLDFANQEQNTTSTARTVTVTNIGGRPMELVRIAPVGGDAGDFNVSEACTRTVIQPERDCRLEITFTPQATGPRQTTLTLRDRFGTNQGTVTLRGNGTPQPSNQTAILNFNPGNLDFGDQTVNQESGVRRIVVTNNGGQPITIRSVNTSGDGQNDFIGSETCTQTPIAPNANCTLDLKFRPTVRGTRSANLLISDASGNQWNIPVRGNGVVATPQVPSLSYSPGSLFFGGQDINTNSREQLLTVTNTGTQPLTVNQVNFVNGSSEDFRLTRNTCFGNGLTPNGTCQIGVVFSPRTQGERQITLQIRSNDPKGDANVFISGFGVAPATSSLTVTPNNVNFGSINLDSRSDTQQLLIRNTGNAPLQIGNIQVTGNPDFISDTSAEIGRNCQFLTLGPGQTCQFGVAFLPQTAGDRAANIAIPSNVGARANVQLRGVGIQQQVPAITVNPMGLEFGTAPQGSTSPPQAITITNRGNGVLRLGPIGIRGTHPNDFFATGIDFEGCTNRVLSPNENCTFRIFFGPTGAGDRAAQLTIPSNDPQGQVTVNLRGVGGSPASPGIVANPVAIDFGTQPLNTSTTRILTLSNNGTANLQINDISISNTSDYGIDLNPPDAAKSCVGSPLTPGAACTMGVTFRPVVEGDRRTRILILSNAGDGTTNVDVTGFGAAAQTLPPGPTLFR